jgi:hypothetical protein
MNNFSWIQPNLFEGIAIIFVVILIPTALLISVLAIIKFLFTKFKISKNNKITIDK